MVKKKRNKKGGRSDKFLAAIECAITTKYAQVSAAKAKERSANYSHLKKQQQFPKS